MNNRKQDFLINCANSEQVALYFEIGTKIFQESWPTKDSASIVKDSKKQSAAEFYGRVKMEAKSVAGRVEFALEEIDAALAERKAYCEYVKKRSQFWQTARKSFLESEAKENGSRLASGDTGNKSICTNGTDESGQASQSTAHGPSGDGNTRPKVPSLNDYQFSETTMALLRGEHVRKQAELKMQRPRLEEYGFSSGDFSRPQAAIDAGLKMVPTERLDKLEAPACLSKCNGSSQAAKTTVDTPGARVAAALEKYRMVDETAKDSGGSSKCSGSGSLMGSFLDDYPMPNFSIVPIIGPVVTGNLEFDSCTFDEVVGSFSVHRGPAPAPPQSVKESTDASEANQCGAITKPSKPKLTSITLDSPSDSPVIRPRSHRLTNVSDSEQ